MDAPTTCRRSVSEEFLARQIAAERAAKAGEATDNLIASLHALNMPEEQRWERAGNRVREERLMGLYPRRVSITATELFATPGEAINAAHAGAHVAVTERGERAVVIVGKETYDRLRLERRMLGFEQGGERAPDWWPDGDEEVMRRGARKEGETR